MYFDRFDITEAYFWWLFAFSSIAAFYAATYLFDVVCINFPADER
jgi:hypothetical protein